MTIYSFTFFLLLFFLSFELIIPQDCVILCVWCFSHRELDIIHTLRVWLILKVHVIYRDATFHSNSILSNTGLLQQLTREIVRCLIMFKNNEQKHSFITLSFSLVVPPYTKKKYLGAPHSVKALSQVAPRSSLS